MSRGGTRPQRAETLQDRFRLGGGAAVPQGFASMPRRFQRRFPATLLLALSSAALAGPSVSAGWTPSELGRPVVRNFPAREFVGSAQVWQIAQDDDSLLYFGNRPGLVTFDGATWRRIAIRGLTDTCRAVVRAPDGRVYVAGQDFFGWLRPAGGPARDFVSLTENLTPAERRFGDVENIAPHAGLLYLNAARELLRWRDRRLEPLPAALREWTHALHGDTGPHYAYQPGGSFQRIDPSGAVKLSEDPRLTASQIRFCPTLADGSLLVVQASGDLWQLRHGEVREWPHQQADYLRDKKLARGWQLPDGTLAFAILNGGLVFYSPDGKFLARLEENSGLRNNLVLSLLAAHDGGLWLGLYNGAARLDWPLAWTLFDRRSGLPTSSARVVTRAHGTLYALTAEGLFGLVPATGPETPAHFVRVLDRDYYALLETEAGFLVVDGEGFALERRSDGEKKFPTPSTAGGHTFALLRSRRDPSLVWVGGAGGVSLLRETSAGWRDEGHLDGFADNVRTLAEAADGRLWGAVPGRGVFRLTPGPDATPLTDARIEFFAASSDGQAPGPAVTHLAAWGDEIVFTAGDNARTVFRFDSATRRFEPFPGVPPLPDNLPIAGNVFSAPAPDHLWLRRTFTRNAEKKIYRVARDGRVDTLPQAVSDAIDDVTAFHEEDGPDGRVLWIAGTEGLLRVDLARAFSQPPPLKTLLWSPGARIADGARLPYAAGSPDFEFVAPHYASVHAPEYQWRLDGEADAWSEWSADRKRTFTHLTEGRYRFEVRARDVDGHVSAPATLAFTILAPWWRTPWAYAGYVFAFGGTLLGFARLRTRALERKNARLEKVVATRTEDLRRQNTELARLHRLELDEKISARLAAEKAQLDVLRYQLNPHFLFNSLTSIRSQIPPALGSARDTLDRLADFCRLTLHGRRSEERTTVGEELAMLRAYLDIEQTRLGELLSVAFEVEPALDSIAIPRLLLLPLVENALKYGQATSTDLLELRISGRRSADGASLEFAIANSGTWVERGSRPGIPSTGIGHDNLRERLRRHYPDAHAFTHEAGAGWVTVRLVLTISAFSN